MLLTTESSPATSRSHARVAGGLELLPLQDTARSQDASDQIQDPAILRDAKVKLEPSVYAAVLVAAFGGVKIELSPGRYAKVHPFLILLCCLPVITVQLSAIIALRTDMALEEPFHDSGSDRGRQLLTLKIVMVLVVYIMNFQTLLNSTQLILFMLNPLTAVEAKLPSSEEWVGRRNASCWWVRCCFSWVSLAPWPCIALFLNVFFAYTVCGDSMSVILGSRTTTDTVFNSLAITFIADLGRIWWEFLASILHLSSLSDFRFKLKESSKVWRPDGQLTEQTQETLVCRELVNLIAYCTFWRPPCKAFNQTRTFLSRGAGARKLETIVSLIIMYGIYKRQLLVLLLAIDTNVLPAARVVCAYWRVHFGIGARNMLEYMPTLLLHAVEKMYIISASDQLKLSVEGKLQGHCTEPKYAYVDEFFGSIQSKYRHITLTFSLVMGAWLVGPSLWFILHRLLLGESSSRRADGTGSIDDEQEEEIDELEAATRRHARRLERLELGMHQVQQNLQERPASLWFR